MKEWFDNFLAPYMKIEQACYQTAGCWHKRGVVKTLNHGSPAFETAVGISDSTIGWGTMTFRTAKGAYFDLDGSGVGNSRGLFGINTDQATMAFYFGIAAAFKFKLRTSIKAVSGKFPVYKIAAVIYRYTGEEFKC